MQAAEPSRCSEFAEQVFNRLDRSTIESGTSTKRVAFTSPSDRRTLTSLPDSWATSLCVKLQRSFDSSAALQLIYAIRSERETARQFSIEPSGDFDFIGSAHVSDRVFDLCDVHNSLTLPFQARDSIASPSEAYFQMINPSFEAKKSSP